MLHPRQRIAIEHHQNESILYCLYLEGGLFVASLLPTRGNKNLHIQYCDVNAMFDCPEAFNCIGCLFLSNSGFANTTLIVVLSKKWRRDSSRSAGDCPIKLANLVCCDGDVVGEMPTPSS